jgi:hypothetical protein
MNTSRKISSQAPERSIKQSPKKLRAGSGKLRGKPALKLRVHQLPFVGRDHENKSDSSICFWDVPMTGGYSGGCDTGREIALMYLAYLREIQVNPGADNGSAASDLTRILRDISGKVPADEQERDSSRGQMVGFASEINRFLIGAIGAGLGSDFFDNFDWKASTDLANEGLIPAPLRVDQIAPPTIPATRKRA